MQIHEEDILKFIVFYLKANPQQRGNINNSYADVCLPNLIGQYTAQMNPKPSEESLYAKFSDMAWELCRIGVLRPGRRKAGSGGGDELERYTLTSFGEKWLAELDDYELFYHYGRFSELLGKFQTQFGNGYFQRAMEAVFCFQVQANLACCVMCGAAAESIVLTVSITKIGEEKANKKYREGIQELIKILVKNNTNLTDFVRDNFYKVFSLLKEWRDEGGHGKSSPISSEEAYLSLKNLLYFARFIERHWAVLTKI